jgi:hypothetical protein
MSFALDKMIPIGICKILRYHIKNAIIKNVQDIDAGEAASGMAGICLLDVC